MLYCAKGTEAFCCRQELVLNMPVTLSDSLHVNAVQTLCSQMHESTARWLQILSNCFLPAVPSCVTWTETLCFFIIRKVFFHSLCSHVAHSDPPYASCSGTHSHWQWKHSGSGGKTDLAWNLTTHCASCVPTTSSFIWHSSPSSIKGE